MTESTFMVLKINVLDLYLTTVAASHPGKTVFQILTFEWANHIMNQKDSEGESCSK